MQERASDHLDTLNMDRLLPALFLQKSVRRKAREAGPHKNKDRERWAFGDRKDCRICGADPMTWRSFSLQAQLVLGQVCSSFTATPFVGNSHSCVHGAKKFSDHRNQLIPLSQLAAPDHEDTPAHAAQSVLVLTVSLGIPRKFPGPKLCPCFWNLVPRWTLMPMPETTMNENDLPKLWEDHIRPAR